MDQPREIKPAMIDPLHSMLGYQLRRTSVAVMSALADELAPLDINPGEASLLMVIGANQGCTQSDISRALGARPANLVPLINKLALSGVVERAPGKGRAIALSLSKAGEGLYAKVERIFAEHEARIGRGVPVDRREELIELLRRIGDDACVAMHCEQRRPGVDS